MDDDEGVVGKGQGGGQSDKGSLLKYIQGITLASTALAPHSPHCSPRGASDWRSITACDVLAPPPVVITGTPADFPISRPRAKAAHVRIQRSCQAIKHATYVRPHLLLSLTDHSSLISLFHGEIVRLALLARPGNRVMAGGLVPEAWEPPASPDYHAFGTWRRNDRRCLAAGAPENARPASGVKSAGCPEAPSTHIPGAGPLDSDIRWSGLCESYQHFISRLLLHTKKIITSAVQGTSCFSRPCSASSNRVLLPPYYQSHFWSRLQLHFERPTAFYSSWAPSRKSLPTPAASITWRLLLPGPPRKEQSGRRSSSAKLTGVSFPFWYVPPMRCLRRAQPSSAPDQSGVPIIHISLTLRSIRLSCI